MGACAPLWKLDLWCAGKEYSLLWKSVWIRVLVRFCGCLSRFGCFGGVKITAHNALEPLGWVICCEAAERER